MQKKQSEAELLKKGKKIKINLIFPFAVIFSVLLSGCAPKQLYPGERLPKEKVSIVRQEQGSQVAIDEHALTRLRPSAEVLPGLHLIECHNVIWHEAYDCETFSQHDYIAENRCYEKRNKEISAKGSSSESCNSCEFAAYKKRCKVPQRSVACVAQLPLAAGQEYQVRCGGNADKNYKEGALFLNGTVHASCSLGEVRVVEVIYNCGSGCSDYSHPKC